MAAVRELCTSSFQAFLSPTLASPPGTAGTVTAAGRQRLASAATGQQGQTEIEAGGAFVNLFARVEGVSELTVLHPNLQQVPHRNINPHDVLLERLETKELCVPAICHHLPTVLCCYVFETLLMALKLMCCSEKQSAASVILGKPDSALRMPDS